MARIKGVPAGQATRAASPVAGRLGRIGAWCYDHRRRVLLGAKIPAGDVKTVIAKAESYAEPGLQVALGGPPISAVISPSPGSAEGIGISAAIAIMLVAFGSVVAMGLPILTALAGGSGCRGVWCRLVRGSCRCCGECADACGGERCPGGFVGDGLVDRLGGDQEPQVDRCDEGPDQQPRLLSGGSWLRGTGRLPSLRSGLQR